MRKLNLTGLLILLLTISGIAQSEYSKSNLEHLSTEQLNEYLFKAKKMRRTGLILSLIGSGLYLSGYALASPTWNGSAASWTMSILTPTIGLMSTIAGIPVLASGSSKYNRIERVMKNRDIVRVEIAPCNNFDVSRQNYQVGLAIKITY